MIKLSYAISKVIVDEYGQQEFLRRLILYGFKLLGVF
jgi:hypothetical protein